MFRSDEWDRTHFPHVMEAADVTQLPRASAHGGAPLEDTALTNEEKAILDREWSRRVAAIAVATLTVAKPQLLSLTPEQLIRCTEIVSEEIFVRLVIGDRPLV